MTTTTDVGSSYMSAPNPRAIGTNAIEYAYRDVGSADAEVPLVLLQHCRHEQFAEDVNASRE